MASKFAEQASRKRRAETEDSGFNPRASKTAKIQKRVNSKQDSNSSSSDPENQLASTIGRRPIYPEGPPGRPPTNLDDPDVISLLRKNWGAHDVEEFRRGFKKLTRRPLADKDLKPPKASGDLRIQLDDSRKTKGNALSKEIYLIQSEDYHELIQGENTILYDENDSSVFGVVIWDFIKDGSVPGTLGYGLIEWIDETVCKLGGKSRNARRDDLGTMPQLGYTRGHSRKNEPSKAISHSRTESSTKGVDDLSSEIAPQMELDPTQCVSSPKASKGKAKTSVPLALDADDKIEWPLFDWSRSLTSKNYTVGELRGFLHEATSIQSLLWTAYQPVMPAEITEDSRETMQCHALPSMDWYLKGKPVTSHITVKANGKAYDLSGFELGPPGAVVGMNYAKVIHNEHNANTYVISFTTNRTTGPDEGRNFLFAKYGVKVPNARNTVIVHRVTDAHGTTLPHRLPAEEKDKSKPLQQSGISMLIQNSLPSAWSKYKSESDEVYAAKKRALKDRRNARRGRGWEAALGNVGLGSESEEDSSEEEEEEKEGAE